MHSIPYGGWLLIAFILGALLIPVLSGATRSIASPYSKADLRRRYLAAAIDIALLLPVFATRTQPVVAFVLASVYLTARDGLGRSVGKLLTGLMVIQVESGLPCNLQKSIVRNILFALPGVNFAALIFESVAMSREALGNRLGDRLARTQVVVGKDVREVVKNIQDQLMHSLICLGQDGESGPESTPQQVEKNREEA
jgi:hypothetical protein